MARTFQAIVVGSVMAFSAITQAYALNSRTWISGAGIDQAGCGPIANPCRTLQYAHDQTSAGGEIDVKDSAGYGNITLTKAITIVGDGSLAGVLTPANTDAITINAGASDDIVLRGLTIEGAGVANGGITFVTGKSLKVENCVVRKFLFSGLTQTNNGSNPVAVTISNSYFTDNGTNGILFQPNGTGSVTASIDRTVMSGNNFAGLNLLGQVSTGGISVTMTDSVVANNNKAGNGTGVLAQSALNKSVTLLHVTNSIVTGNSFGVSSNGPNSAVVLGRSTVTSNTTGYSVTNSGQVVSFKDNYILSNSANTGSLTTGTPQ